MGIFRRKTQDQERAGGIETATREGHPIPNDSGTSVTHSEAMTFEFTPEILKEIHYAVKGGETSARVLYEDNMQFLDVVGESFRQPLIADLLERFDREHWFTGYLQPEPTNSYDPNAVMVMLISKKEKGVYEANHVGYLAKEQAKKVSKKIAKFLNEGKIIPLIGIIDGGEKGKESLGVSARAVTRSMNF